MRPLLRFAIRNDVRNNKCFQPETNLARLIILMLKTDIKLVLILAQMVREIVTKFVQKKVAFKINKFSYSPAPSKSLLVLTHHKFALY